METIFENLTEKEIKKINEGYLKAFESNFKPIKIVKNRNMKLYGITQDEHIINICDTIEELNGWLYGCVQANNKRIIAKERV